MALLPFTLFPSHFSPHISHHSFILTKPFFIAKLMLDECKQDKALFIAKIKEIGKETWAQVNERLEFEFHIADLWKFKPDQEKELW